jgi:hypothetical protein
VLIESLVRMGRPYLKVPQPAAEGIRQITDVDRPDACNFWRHVFLVEIDAERERVLAHPVMQWGEEGQSQGPKGFQPETERTVTAPFTLPSGGNPRLAQGRYGVPVYLLYEKDFDEMADCPEKVETYLRARLARTVANRPPEGLIPVVAEQLARQIAAVPSGKEKRLGVVVLASVGPETAYRYAEPLNPDLVKVADSRLRPGEVIVACLDRLMEASWVSKIAEGAEYGEDADGCCSVCGAVGHTVSIYNKAWPWFAVTWSAPLPATVNKKKLVKGTALCDMCYKALTIGGNLFADLTARPLPTWLTRELFSPAGSISAREVQRRQANSVYAGVIILPLTDEYLEDPEECADYVEELAVMRSRSVTGEKGLPLDLLFGIEQAVVPEGLTGDTYRMTAFYYSGDLSRGDIHLRAIIEDVVPSVASAVKTILAKLDSHVSETAKALLLDSRNYGWLSRLPSLLSRAYGQGVLWQAMGQVLHRRSIRLRPMLRNVALRLQDTSRKLPQSVWTMREEVLFYLTFLQFWRMYMEEVVGEKGVLPMRDWRELLASLQSGETSFDSSVDEMGFAGGYLVQQFSRQYFKATQRKGNGDQPAEEKSSDRYGKDYLSHRVITFGGSLSPRDIWRRAIVPMNEIAVKWNIQFSPKFRRQYGAWLMAYRRMEEQIARERDAFIAAFWAGYNLAIVDRDETVEPTEADPEERGVEA